MARPRKEKKPSYFDGYEYKGYRIKTKLVLEGRGRYKPMKLSRSEDVYREFRKLRECDKEKFYSLFLDVKNNVIGVELVSQGCLDTSCVHPREVYKSALLASASSVIFVHNHPSGDPEPSFGDNNITEQLKHAGDIFSIKVLDHIIIGQDSFYSYADKGKLD